MTKTTQYDRTRSVFNCYSRVGHAQPKKYMQIEPKIHYDHMKIEFTMTKTKRQTPDPERILRRLKNGPKDDERDP